ncbi:CsbD family protein [Mycobacterium yunnanensis]|uniref:CsbD family protein n=1 Tax=Mycobacterium yunnanensis TaxID=368477 RepID=A0A9X2YGY1_9MYCO|nr:CsbD family protein [Mycobacterium yunnanensis]MCV7419203.1 CsbD family protein [Mycobacterium yunnanensis]
MSTSKKAKHTVDKLAGRVKENFGEITGNDRLRAEGKADQVKARVKMSGERLKDAVRGR